MRVCEGELGCALADEAGAEDAPRGVAAAGAGGDTSFCPFLRVRELVDFCKN